jgi:hypothetical protein
MKEETIVAQRIVYDAIVSGNVQVNREMLKVIFSCTFYLVGW